MSVINLPDVIILNGATDSGVVDTSTGFWDLVSGIVINSPTTLPETVKIYVSDLLAGTFHPLQSGGADITFPADKATPVNLIAFHFFKLVASSGAVGGDRTFKITGREEFMGQLH